MYSTHIIIYLIICMVSLLIMSTAYIHLIIDLLCDFVVQAFCMNKH